MEWKCGMNNEKQMSNNSRTASYDTFQAVNDQLAGIFKILALVIHSTQNVDSVNNLISRLSNVVLETNMLNDARCCILEGDKY